MMPKTRARHLPPWHASPAATPMRRTPASTSARRSARRPAPCYPGTNVENAAYPLGNCAEASAIAAGVQAEGAGFRIAETAVWALDRRGRGDRHLALRRLPPAHPRVRGRRRRESALPVAGRQPAYRDRRRTPALRIRVARRLTRRDLAAAGVDPHQARRRGARCRRTRERSRARIADGSLSDAQVGAFAMAVTLRGMTPAECADFTRARARQRRVFDWRGGVAAGPGARQAFDRRRRRPRLARARSDARGLRRLGADDRAAAGSRTRAARSTSSSRFPVTSRGRRPSACAGPCARRVSRSSAPATASRRPTGASTRSAT